MTRRKLTPILAAALLAAGCSADDDAGTDEGFVYQNQLFSGTDLITPAQSGDLSSPSFSWPATERRHVVCAIFSERIQIAEDLITNTDRLVWIWHSGLGQGREGNVLFSHGVGDPETLAPPSALSPSSYYWGVWALDLEGRPVASSREQTLSVPEKR